MALLHEEIQKRYLSYALSVITSRAIPDIRDGLKPVQRRILYAMHKDLKLKAGTKFRKSAAITGATMGKYHPHGDQAIYEAMVRMAQDFSLRYPLVDGQGNFGSIDGDGAAAQRYTEARLQPLAERMLEELSSETVDLRPNYDGTADEPSVLPSQVPNLLINGATGIAVGLATNIPPHNLKEVVDACCDLISNPNRRVGTLVRNHVRGPDFPTGGVILESPEEIEDFYETGKGTFTVRSRWDLEKLGRGRKAIVITEIPYTAQKDALVEKIAQHVIDEKIPQISDVRDESTDDIRIVLELKRGADHEVALAYLFKHTPLEDRFHMNLTCLLSPDANGLQMPERVDLKTALRQFLDFRFEVTERKLQYRLEKLEARIHILEAFRAAFEDIDRVIKLVQSSKSKKDARNNVMKVLKLDERQAEAVVTTPLYRLASTEKQDILDELETKAQEKQSLEKVLDDTEAVWSLVRSELREIGRAYGDARRTSIEAEVSEFDYNEEDYIEAEDLYVIVSRDGWVRTQKSYGDLSSLRCRDGDEIGWALPANSKDSVLFFTNAGKCYTIRAVDLPNTVGYGDPIQGHFQFSDGEQIVNVLPVNALVLDGHREVLSLSRQGKCLRFDLEDYFDPSTVVGRTFHRLEDDDGVVNVCLLRDDDYVVLATYDGRGTTFDATEVKKYKGPGKGVRAIRLKGEDLVLAYTLCGENQGSNLHVETNRGSVRMITHQTYEPLKRDRAGYQIIKRGHLIRWHRQPVELRYDGDKS